MDKTNLAYADVSITQKATKDAMTRDIDNKMGKRGEAIYKEFLVFLSPKNPDGTNKDVSLNDFKKKFAALLPKLNDLTPQEAKAVLAMMKYELRNLTNIAAKGETEVKEGAREGIKPWLPEIINVVEDAVTELKDVAPKRE
jgi:hypothetical protein